MPVPASKIRTRHQPATRDGFLSPPPDTRHPSDICQPATRGYPPPTYLQLWNMDGSWVRRAQIVDIHAHTREQNPYPPPVTSSFLHPYPPPADTRHPSGIRQPTTRHPLGTRHLRTRI